MPGNLRRLSGSQGFLHKAPSHGSLSQTGFYLLKTATRGSKPGGEQKKGRTNYGNENHN
nr:MAG TPA: hypothetical protein [Caudoviricetes sp.]